MYCNGNRFYLMLVVFSNKAIFGRFLLSMWSFSANPVSTAKCEGMWYPKGP